MTEDMKRLLHDASDDGGRPVGFVIEKVVAKGRRRVRRRRTGFAAVAGVAVLGLTAGAVTVLPSEGQRKTDLAGSSSLIERCAALDRAFVATVGAEVPPIGDWSVTMRADGDAAVSLILTPPEGDGRGYAFCRLDQTGGDAYDDYFRWGSAGGGDLAFSRAHDDAGHVVVTMAGSWTNGSLAFTTADGITSEPDRQGPYYLWQYEMDGVDPNAPVTATYLRPDGSVINTDEFTRTYEWGEMQPDLPGVGPQSDAGTIRPCTIEYRMNGPTTLHDRQACLDRQK